MNIPEVILLLAGIFLCFSLSFAVYTLCRYLRNRDKTIRNGAEHKSLIESSNSVDIPFSIRTITTQLPTTNNIGENWTPTHNHQLPVIRNMPNPVIVVTDGDYPMSTYSLPILSSELFDSTSQDESYILKNRTLTDLDKKQRHISAGVIEHLEKQGRKVCDYDLRTYSTAINGNSTDNRKSTTSSLDSLQSDCDESVLDTSVFTIGGIDECPNDGVRKLGSNRMKQQAGPLGNLKRQLKKTGKISIKTKFQNNTLEVWVLRVFDFDNKKRRSAFNTFVLLYMMPGNTQKQVSKFIKGSREFDYNEQFRFFDLDLKQIQNYCLTIKLMNYSRFKKKKVLGEAQIVLSSLNYSCEEIYNLQLFSHVKLKTSLASLKISICHQATLSKLDVIIVEAKRLPKLLNPYVTVSLFREQSIDRKDTVIKYNTRDPVFNESIEFDISTDFSRPLSVFTMVATINSASLMGKNDVIGHVIFSLNSPQSSAANHWKLVQDMPHRYHSEWHSLLDPDDI